MGKEIERKFLVKNHSYRDGASCKTYRQGYISTHPARVIRVRTDGERGTGCEALPWRCPFGIRVEIPCLTLRTC